MTRMRDRFFAGFGALLFLLSATALTIVVIVSSVGQKKDAQSQTTANSASACDSSATIASAALPAPEVFKPEGEVQALDKTTLEAGNGATLKKGDCVQVKYLGSLAKDGSVFDGNFDKPTAFQFQLGQGNVIQGWDQGLVGSKVGDTVRLVIPANLAYGSQSNSAIPANSALVFVVKVLKVTK